MEINNKFKLGQEVWRIKERDPVKEYVVGIETINKMNEEQVIKYRTVSNEDYKLGEFGRYYITEGDSYFSNVTDLSERVFKEYTASLTEAMR